MDTGWGGREVDVRLGVVFPLVVREDEAIAAAGPAVEDG